MFIKSVVHYISTIFEKHGSTDMGRYSNNEVSADLKTGVTHAILIFSGKMTLLRDKSKMHLSKLVRS